MGKAQSRLRQNAELPTTSQTRPTTVPQPKQPPAVTPPAAPIIPKSCTGPPSHIPNVSTSANCSQIPDTQNNGSDHSTEIPNTQPEISSTHRLNGNDFFKKFISSTNYPDQKKCLHSAIQCYRLAYNAVSASGSTTEVKKHSCMAAKNGGTATWKLVQVLIKTGASPKAVEMYYREAIELFSKALATGNVCMEVKWVTDLTALYTKCVKAAINHALTSLPKEEISGAVEQHIQSMTENSEKAKCFWVIAHLTFQEGIVALGTRDFKTALNAFHECFRPISELTRFLPFATAQSQLYFAKEVGVMEQDLSFHLATAESLQAITIGDELLKIATEGKNAGNINLYFVYDVVDWYRKAVLGAREIEVEVEAIALSRLGCLYDKVLNMRYKAKEYFLRCVQLGISLNRKDLQAEDWCKTSMTALKRYQEDAAKNDDAAHQQERKKYLDELVKELAQLNQTNRTSIELIRFVYTTFPPKDSKHTIPEDDLKDETNVKKGLLKAILHYHPDKVDVSQHGKKWQTLCGEITRALTAKYEGCKFG